MARAPKSIPGETPARVLSDEECAALAHYGPLTLDPEIWVQVKAYQDRMRTMGREGIVRTIPGPLVTGEPGASA